MPQRQLPGQSPKAVRGTIDRVPCPHCGKLQDFRILSEQQLLDTGHQVFCDYCGHSQLVVQITTITTVAVRQDPSGKVRPQSQRVLTRRQQLGAQKPGFFQRLLGKG